MKAIEDVNFEVSLLNPVDDNNNNNNNNNEDEPQQKKLKKAEEVVVININDLESVRLRMEVYNYYY